MKVFIAVILVALSVAAVSAQGTKVGVVDPNTVVQESKKGKAFFAGHTAFINQKQLELKKETDAFQVKQDDLKKNATTMSPDQLRIAQAELQRMQTDIKRKQEDAQAEVNRRLEAGLSRMQREIAPLVKQVAVEKGLNLVLLNNPNTGVFYFDKTVDITADVTAKYDAMQTDD